MTDGPLDHFDAIAVGIGEPGGQEVVRAVRRAGGVRLEAPGDETSDRCGQVLHLDDDVVEAARVDRASGGIVASSRLTNSSPGNFSIVKLPNSVSGTEPTTSYPRFV